MAKAPKPLLIVESPTKAQTIRRLLGDSYAVTASQGHIRDLPQKGKGLSIQKTPEGHRFLPTYALLPKKEAIVQKVKAEVAEAAEVWLATDEDREGEAIAWHLATLLGLDPNAPIRITFHEITRRALEAALRNPRPINTHLVNAQQARRILDRLVGYEVSPLLWRTFPQKKGQSALSAGRVQSVALRLIVEREREIAHFTPKVTLAAEVTLEAKPPFKASLTDPKLKDLPEAITLLKALVGRQLVVNALDKKQRRRSPAAPFTTSTLQQEAQRRLGFSLQRTMRAAQSLYEKGFITYMRTDSVHLAPEALQAIHATLRERFGPDSVQARSWEGRQTLHAQEAHEAIRPTDPTRDQAGDTPDETKLYHLIWRRTLASQMPDALYEETLVHLLPDSLTTPQLTFTATGRVLVRPGFLTLYGYEEEEETPTLPPLRVGERLPWQQVRVWERFSSPPPRYTEGTLVKELESRGIGRPSTYAPTVETLFKRAYIRRDTVRVPRPPYQEVLLYPEGQIQDTLHKPPPELQKNKLLPTELGMRVLDFLVEQFPEIFDYDFTARVEEQLDQIAAAQLDWQEMLDAFYERFTAKLSEAQENRRNFQHRLLGYHPVQQKPIQLHIGRNGAFVSLAEKGDPDYKTASVPSSWDLRTLSLEQALELLSFPRTVGTYEGEPILLTSGPYGYYLKHAGKNYPLLPGMSPFSLTEAEAIEAIEAKRQGGPKVLMTFPETQIEVLQGRYGPYLRHPGGTCSLPKGISLAGLTAEQCQAILAAQAEKKKGTPPSRRAKNAKERR